VPGVASFQAIALAMTSTWRAPAFPSGCAHAYSMRIAGTLYRNWPR
jgi:hypothetical protein